MPCLECFEGLVYIVYFIPFREEINAYENIKYFIPDLNIDTIYAKKFVVFIWNFIYPLISIFRTKLIVTALKYSSM